MTIRRDRSSSPQGLAPAEAGEPLRAARLAGLARVRAEGGQSAVEFALVLPLIVILVLALYGGGKVLFYWHNGGQVANEGARMLAVNAKSFPGGMSFENYLKSQTVTLGSDGAPTVVVDFESVDGYAEQTAGSAATVWVCRTYAIPFVRDITIRAKATMRLERNVTVAVPTGSGC
jgi:Flp pilus assembly protein TadG